MKLKKLSKEKLNQLKKRKLMLLWQGKQLKKFDIFRLVRSK
jgi:hypothetical protein